MDVSRAHDGQKQSQEKAENKLWRRRRLDAFDDRDRSGRLVCGFEGRKKVTAVARDSSKSEARTPGMPRARNPALNAISYAAEWAFVAGSVAKPRGNVLHQKSDYSPRCPQ